MKSLVIGIDGVSGVGKTSTAKLLCENNNDFKYIELGDLCRAILPFWIKLKKIYQKQYIINFIKNLNVDYTINNNKIEFRINKDIENIEYSKGMARRELYKMVSEKEIINKIYFTLREIINKVRNTYSIILVGREVELIYPTINYHFYLKADEQDRIQRLMNRDKITEAEAKERKVEEQLHNFFKEVITINTSRVDLQSTVEIIENTIQYKNGASEKVKVLFMGAQSTGKTTISKLCANNFKEPYIGEKLRYCMEKNKLKFSDIFLWEKSKWHELINAQIESEKKMKEKAKKFTFADSAALLYSIDFNLLDDSKIKQMVDQQIKDAGIIFVCDNEFPYEEDEIRPSISESNIDLCEQKIKKYLRNNNIRFILLGGSVEERFKTVEQILRGF